MNVRLLAKHIEAADDGTDGDTDQPSAPPATGSYEAVIAHDRAHAARHRRRQAAAAAAAGADPPEAA